MGLDVSQKLIRSHLVEGDSFAILDKLANLAMRLGKAWK